MGLVVLAGCFKDKEYPEFKVTVFYSDTCGNCTALKSKLIPLIEEEFGDKVTIELVSADDINGQNAYGEIVGYHNQDTDELIEGKLDNFEADYIDKYYIPFVVIDDKYAFIGYNANFNDYYIADIKSALDNKPLSDTMDNDRWYFKD